MTHGTGSGYACLGCGAALTKAWTGANPKWCSERCRKTQYGGRCANCGARTNGSDGYSGAPDLCHPCNVQRNAELQRSRAENRADLMLKMRRQGATSREIAATLGMTRESVARSLKRLRDRGIEVPRDPYMENRGTVLTSGAADKTPGNQSGPATVGAAPDRGNQERGS